MAKVHLIYFDLYTGYYPSFHHGLAYIIGTLKEDNHSVCFSHLKTEKDIATLKDRLSSEKTDIVGLSFTTNQKKYVRSLLKNMPLTGQFLIAGGVHCTLVKEKIFEEFPDIDGICVGEGEIPLRELCRKINAKKDYTQTQNFYFRSEKGIIKNVIKLNEDVDSLALPDYSLFDYRKIIEESGGFFPMFLTRGCPYDCHYCCNHVLREAYENKTQYVRFFLPHVAIKIVKNNLSLYRAAKSIGFSDDTFTLNKKWLLEFCKLYKEEINLPFLCNARVETIDDEIVRSLKSAGCFSIEFGVESGNEWLRQYILNRRHSNKEIENAFLTVTKYGVKTLSYNMFGLPFETKEMQSDTLNFNFKIRPNLGKCYYFYPYPGTKLYNLCNDYELSLDNLEERSGYLEGPTLKEIFVLDRETISNYRRLQLYFYLRLLCSKIAFFGLLEKPLYAVLSLFNACFAFLANSSSKDSFLQDKDYSSVNLSSST